MLKQALLIGCILLSVEGFGQPKLLVTPAMVEQVRQKIATEPWAQRSWERVKRHCDSLLEETLKVPPRGSNWSHYYVNPDNGEVLKTSKQIGEWQWEHLDPKTGKVYYGDPSRLDTDYDGIVIFFYHHSLANNAAMLGLAYQLSNDARYAKKAIKLLRDYASRYPKYPIRDKYGLSDINAWTGAGRVHVQSLGESLWTLQMAIGADFVWDVLTENDRKVLYDSLFRPATDLILAHRMRDPVHNIECWKNSAVAAVGFLYGDQFLVNSALNDPARGYYQQLNKGLTPEGLWWEMAPSYHFYSFYPLWAVTQMAENNGINIDWSGIRRMLDGPLLMANAQLELPQINDSKPVNLGRRALYYDLGYSRFGDKKYLPILADYDRSSVSGPGGQFLELALLYGRGDISQSPGIPAKSTDLKGSGVSTFRVGEGKGQLSITLKYVNPEGWHSHPDILGLSMYRGKEQLLVDPGHTRYSSYLHKGWYKTSIAHNTVVINQSDQAFMGVNGRCLAFDSVANYGVYQTTEGYEDFEFTRAILVLDENSLLVFDQVKTQGKDTLDLALHIAGEWQDRPPGKPLVLNANGYKYLEDPVISTPKPRFSLRTNTGSSSIDLSVSLARPSRCITAYGVDEAASKVPAMIFRNQGDFQAAAYLVTWDGSQPDVELEKPSDTGVYLVKIEREKRTKKIGINLTGKAFKYKGLDYSGAYVEYFQK